MDSLFAPPDEPWQRLSPRYATARRLVGLIVIGLVAAVSATITGVVTGDWVLVAVIAGVGLALTGWQWWHAGRWVRSWGYAERDDDLYITKGLLFKSLTVIPYGRMQLVKVESGPLERALGLASVSLITASVQTDARIPGLPEPEAIRLRDRLTEVGVSQDAGL